MCRPLLPDAPARSKRFHGISRLLLLSAGLLAGFVALVTVGLGLGAGSGRPTEGVRVAEVSNSQADARMSIGERLKTTMSEGASRIADSLSTLAPRPAVAEEEPEGETEPDGTRPTRSRSTPSPTVISAQTTTEPQSGRRTSGQAFSVGAQSPSDEPSEEVEDEGDHWESETVGGPDARVRPSSDTRTAPTSSNPSRRATEAATPTTSSGRQGGELSVPADVEASVELSTEAAATPLPATATARVRSTVVVATATRSVAAAASSIADDTLERAASPASAPQVPTSTPIALLVPTTAPAIAPTAAPTAIAPRPTAPSRPAIATSAPARASATSVPSPTPVVAPTSSGRRGGGRGSSD